MQPEAAQEPDVFKPNQQWTTLAVYIRTADGSPDTETTTTASDTKSIPDEPVKSTTGIAHKEALATQADLIERDINEVDAVEVAVELTTAGTVKETEVATNMAQADEVVQRQIAEITLSETVDQRNADEVADTAVQYLEDSMAI